MKDPLGPLDAKEPWGDLAIVPVMHSDGVHPTYIDLNLCRAVTVEYPNGYAERVRAEMRMALASDNSARGFTPWESL